MICPQCGFNCKDGARFCGKCGNKLADISNFTVSENSSELSKQLPQNNISNPSSTLSIGTPEPDSLSDTLENKPLSDELNSSDNTSLPVNTEKKIKINLKREVPKKKRRIGYSKVVSTPEFIAKLRQHNFKNLLKGLLLIIAPTVFLFVYSLFPNGGTSGDAIKFGLGIGVVISLFLSIIFLQRTFGKPWEGIVMSKKFETRTRQKGKYHTETYVVYVLTLITDTGKTKYIEEYDHSGYYYEHFNVDDRVKYHPSFDYYEKFEKTNDRVVLCPFCSKVVSIEQNKCSCGAPVIK